MLQLINDLSGLSNNSPLFEHLRSGGDLKVAHRLAESSGASSKPGKAELLRAFRDAIVPALQNSNISPLQQLLETEDINARVTIVGELILTLYAVHEGKQSDEKVVNAIRDQAFRLTLDLAQAFEATPPQDTNDKELLAHGIAMREWAHLFAVYYQAVGKLGHRTEMLMVRARVTNTTVSSWPHLVGSAMVEVALALESFGRAELATNCCNGVRMDLHYLVDRIDDPALPEFEKVSAVYWLQRACEALSRLAPGDANAANELQRARDLRKQRGYPDAVSAPRLGPIAVTYLARTPFLALIVGDLERTYDADRDSECVAAICQRYGCFSRDVAFYLSAMGSYQIRTTILAGARMMYDDAHLEVFAAIDYLRQQDDLGKRNP